MTSEVVQQLEKISRAIRALEGLPVDYRLALKLADLQREIAEHCAPAAELRPAKEIRNA